MKTRVIFKNRKYVPQVKTHWFSFWRGICKGHTNAMLGVYQDFDTIGEAVNEINSYLKQIENNGKVVWEGTNRVENTI